MSLPSDITDDRRTEVTGKENFPKRDVAADDQKGEH